MKSASEMEYILSENAIRSFDDNGEMVAEVTFPESGDGVYTINHTFVDGSLRGAGVAAELVKRAVAEIESRGGRVAATCSYAKKWLAENGAEQG